MSYEEKAKPTAARGLIPVGLLVAAPVALIAGAPVRRRSLRSVCRDQAPALLDAEHGRIGVHWFAVTNPVLAWPCWPTGTLAAAWRAAVDQGAQPRTTTILPRACPASMTRWASAISSNRKTRVGRARRVPAWTLA